MKKNTRIAIANPESKRRRALRLAHETVRVLSSTDLGRAAGGSGCITTTDPTAPLTTRTEGDTSIQK
jgi:hypothetical protein